jgi:hypothetical protein
VARNKELSKVEVQKLKHVEKYLTVIETHRLLFNTAEELRQYVGYSKNNSLKKKGGNLFMKDAILQKLVQDARESTDERVNLIDVIDTYEKATSMLDSIKPRHRKLMTCVKLLSYFYANRKADDEIVEVVKHAKVEHVPFLVLMTLGALPRFGHARGDAKNIKRHYDTLFNMFDMTFNGNLLTQKMALKEAIKEDIEEDPRLMNRWHLIYTTMTILEEFGNLCSPEKRAEQLKKTYKIAYQPTDIETSWADYKREDIFWNFERVGDDYLLCQFQLDKENHQIRYIRYEMLFLSEEDDSLIMALLTHPKATRNMLKASATPLSEKYYAYLGVERIDGDLLFEHWFPNNNKWHTLERLTRNEKVKERIAEFEACFDEGSFELINEFEEEEYNFTAPMAAITGTHIYLETNDGHYLKVPKSLDKSLDSISFNHNVFIVTFLDAKWIHFKDFGLSYDVTTPEMLSSNGIETVKDITPDASFNEP